MDPSAVPSYLPCPHCGGTYIQQVINQGIHLFKVSCMSKSPTGSGPCTASVSADSAAKAVGLWNRRAAVKPNTGDAFICARWKRIAEGPATARRTVIFRCDLAEGHADDHFDSIVGARWSDCELESEPCDTTTPPLHIGIDTILLRRMLDAFSTTTPPQGLPDARALARWTDADVTRMGRAAMVLIEYAGGLVCEIFQKANMDGKHWQDIFLKRIIPSPQRPEDRVSVFPAGNEWCVVVDNDRDHPSTEYHILSETVARGYASYLVEKLRKEANAK
ncbi:MAG: hypothetical protein KGL39_50035 [Patescibacteria group bacterium]|nr:hypothetical protein [Patescibacteria group bacterium]